VCQVALAASISDAAFSQITLMLVNTDIFHPSRSSLMLSRYHRLLYDKRALN